MAKYVSKILHHPADSRARNFAGNSRTGKSLIKENARYRDPHSSPAAVYRVSSNLSNFNNFGLLPSLEWNSLAEYLHRTRGNHYVNDLSFRAAPICSQARSNQLPVMGSHIEAGLFESSRYSNASDPFEILVAGYAKENRVFQGKEANISLGISLQNAQRDRGSRIVRSSERFPHGYTQDFLNYHHSTQKLSKNPDYVQCKRNNLYTNIMPIIQFCKFHKIIGWHDLSNLIFRYNGLPRNDINYRMQESILENIIHLCLQISKKLEIFFRFTGYLNHEEYLNMVARLLSEARTEKKTVLTQLNRYKQSLLSSMGPDLPQPLIRSRAQSAASISLVPDKWLSPALHSAAGRRGSMQSTRNNGAGLGGHMATANARYRNSRWQQSAAIRHVTVVIPVPMQLEEERKAPQRYNAPQRRETSIGIQTDSESKALLKPKIVSVKFNQNSAINDGPLSKKPIHNRASKKPSHKARRLSVESIDPDVHESLRMALPAELSIKAYLKKKRHNWMNIDQ